MSLTAAILANVAALGTRGDRPTDDDDDGTALGDTSEVHTEISPHDFPKGAPERQAAEQMAAEEAGEDTTRGHEDPSEREGRVQHESRTTGGG